MSKSTHPDVVEVRKSLGVALTLIRTNLGLSQRQAAVKCGLNQTTISLIERGETSPTLETLAALRVAYGWMTTTTVEHFYVAMAEAQRAALNDSQPNGEHG